MDVGHDLSETIDEALIAWPQIEQGDRMVQPRGSTMFSDFIEQ